jgi:Fur family transcriptional regulator, peroxide stress response regulator
MANKTVIKILVENNLKVTPQRIAVLEVILMLDNHPTTDIIINYIRISHPHVAIGTVYKILETFVKKGIINKVKTDKDIIRYDSVNDKHHHLYCSESDRIEDYYDNDLNNILQNYLKDKKIPDFKIRDIKLQIVGEFTDKNKN